MSANAAKLCCIIFSIVLLISSYVYYQNLLPSDSLHLFMRMLDRYHRQNNLSNISSISPSGKLLLNLTISPFGKLLLNLTISPFGKLPLNLTFSPNTIYHQNGIAYDYYSKDDLGQLNAGDQWKIWSLPHETNKSSSSDNISISPLIVSKLPFVDVIYVLTDVRLTERHNNLKKAFHYQGMATESVDWRMKWNQTTCNSDSNRLYVYKRLNLKDQTLNDRQRRTCALAMKHADVWYEMSERKISLALILEDDAIFVPFFKEKFTRMIYAAIDKGILRMNGTCVKPEKNSISNNEWINQNPMIVIGTCFNFHGQSFQKSLSNAPPVLNTHKSDSSRCTHAYLLTSCSAQALVDQIQAQKNNYLPADFMQNNFFRLSSTLQAFWMDPPLAYQGNQVIDLDKLSTFASQTYMVLD